MAVALPAVAQVFWRWDFFFEHLDTIVAAGRVTLYATAGGIVLAMIIGLFLAVGRQSRRRWISIPVGAYIEFVRSTPLLIHLYVVFFILPLYTPIAFGALTTGIIVIGLHYAAYTAEVYRAGIEAVPKGQWEAARALNFGRAYTWRKIVLPQAVPPVIPALGNYLISMFKDTPQLLAIGVPEILTAAQRIGTRTFRFVEPLTTAAVFFIILSAASALLVRKLERRYGSAVEMPAGGI